MKKSVLLILFVFAFESLINAQAGVWTWMKGDSAVTISTGVYGVQGIPDSANTPPPLYESANWTDLQGNFWLLGGSNNIGDVFNDLWKFDPIANMWAWMKGPGGLVNQVGTYGTLGIPSPTNNPGGRGYGICTWTDKNGNLWLYGGAGYGNTLGPIGSLSDLWKYTISTNQWTWMKGDQVINQVGSYGIQTIASPTNLPPSRCETTTAWADTSGAHWLFGGINGQLGMEFNDLWKYNVATNEFTWMHGSSTPLVIEPAVYGTLGVSSPANTPGSRYPYLSSIDAQNNLWLFGGRELLGSNCGNDVWKFDITLNEWTWMDGPNVFGQPAVYGTMCSANQTNLLFPKFENKATWNDKCGNIINYGGFDANADYDLGDLWYYDITDLKWTWIGGSNIADGNGYYGTKGIPSFANYPPACGGSSSWTDTLGNLWMFGGLSEIDPAFTSPQYYNNLWKFTLTDSTCIPNNCFKTYPSYTTTPFVPELELFIPNVFSPNGDNENELFIIKTEGVKYYHLIIYNRWGEKVFESNDSQIHWNGKIENTKGDASDGTYYYILSLSDYHLKEYTYKGFVTLIR